jgi:hypothetical protein
VMKTRAIPAARRGQKWLLLAVVLFIVGLAAGWLFRERNLLDTTATESSVEQKESAQAQYDYALPLLFADAQSTDTRRGELEARLRAVVDLFPEEDPNNALPVRRAKQQLARLCLNQDRYPEALKWYDQLAALDADPQLKAFGIAGQCAVNFYQGLRRAAFEKLVALKPLWPSPEIDNDLKLRAIITDHVYPELRKELVALNAKDAQEWDELIRRPPASPR